MNMLFGNSSLHDDITLEDFALPASMLSTFPGPGSGIRGLRTGVSAGSRALTCSAIKPQGLPVERLADLTYRFAKGRIDYIKDDHGLADQTYSPFANRVRACAAAARKASSETGHPSRYVPSLSGNLDQLRMQLVLARDEGIDTVMAAPMIIGLPAFCTIARENRDIAFLTHPAMAGAARIAPPLLLGRLFRMLGADGIIFPHHGGRFGYTPAICAELADAARGRWGTLLPVMPIPAGGMTLDRLEEIVNFYGPDVMILIGGNLLMAKDNLTAESLAFTGRLAQLTAEARNG
jgi:ribulose-bisphosphate carboxylase large chain